TFHLRHVSALPDSGDLDRGVLLAMTPAAPVVLALLVLEAGDLGTLGRAQHPSADRSAGQRIGARHDSITVDEKHRGEVDLSVLDTELLDLQLLAFAHPVLLSTGLDDCVHRLCL